MTQSVIELERISLIQSHNESKKTQKITCGGKKYNLWNVYDALFITGRSVHHGNEKNLPKTESKRSMCQGQRSVYFPDVRLLPVHGGRFWVVSSPLCSYSAHFIKPNAQHFINLQRLKLRSKPKAQEDEGLKKLCFIIHNLAFLCLLSSHQLGDVWQHSDSNIFKSCLTAGH